MNSFKFIFFALLSGTLCLAQSKSYEDRLSQIGNQKTDQTLGTLSGQDKAAMQKRELYDAYTYAPKQVELPTPTFDTKDYVEFRKKHNISDYVGDEVVKDLIKSSKDESVKTEAVRLLESEKLLYESYQAYQDSKSTMKDKELKKDSEERIDIIARQSSTMLNSSLQKLSDLKALDLNEDTKGVQYMASGGRVFPKLELDQEKDLLNIRGSMLERVQRELLKVMAQAINEHYHKEQGVTAKEEITSKAQLLSFVKVEDKAQQRQQLPEHALGGASSLREGASSSNAPGIGQRLYRVGPPPPSGWADDNRPATGQNQLLLDRQSGHAPPGGWQDDNKPGTGQSEYRKGDPPPGGWSN